MNVAVNEATKLSILLDIAARAIEAEEAKHARRCSQEELNAAYEAWKNANGIDHVERDSEDWEKMIVATAAEFEALVKTKRAEKNAEKRLRSLVFKYKGIVTTSHSALASIDS